MTRSVDGSVLPEAEEALHQAVIASRIVLTREDLGGTVDWSPEGVFVTEGPENTGTIDLRDETTGESVRSWVGHEDSDVNDVQFSDDGSMLATAGDDGFLKIWDPDTGDEISSVQGATGAVGQSFDADGRHVAATWPEDGIIRVAEAATGDIVRTFEDGHVPWSTRPSARTGAGWPSRDADSDSVPVFDVRTGDVVFELPRHTPSVNSVSWSPNGRWIATGAVRLVCARLGRGDRRARGAAARTHGGRDHGRLVARFATHRLRRERRHGAGVGARGAPHPRDRRGRGAPGVPPGRTADPVGRCSRRSRPTGDTSSRATSGSPAIKIWDLSIEGDAEVVNVPTDPALVDVAYLPDGRIVASHDGGSVAIWNVDRDATEPVATLGPAGGSELPVFLVAPSPDGELVAMVRDLSPVVSVWNVETSTFAFDYDARTDGITSIDWSSDGRYLAVGRVLRTTSRARRGRRWAPNARRLRTRTPSIRALAFAPDGQTIATASFNQEVPDTNHVSIWDWKTGEVVKTLDDVSASSLTYDGSGERLAIGYYDGTVEIRGASTGEVERSFGAGSVTVMNVVFSPNGNLLATGGEDAAIRLFDTHAESGAQQLVLRGHEFVVSGLDFSHDGKRLASAAPDGVVRVWALDLDELIAIAEGELTRPLTDDECRQYLHQEDGCP